MKKETLRKILNGIGLFIMGIGFIFIVGIAGASDCDTITFWQATNRLIIALCMVLAGFGLYRITEE